MKSLTLLLILSLFSSSACSAADESYYLVQYEVVGSTKSVMVTLTKPGASMEQHTWKVPFTLPPLPFGGMDTATISAQKQSERGDVTVRILVNGKVVREATSSSAYGIASVNWTGMLDAKGEQAITSTEELAKAKALAKKPVPPPN
jgi:hypothetical protein